MGRRRQAREQALQALYLADAAHLSAADAYAIVAVGPDLDPKTEEFARSLVHGTLEHRSELDGLITRVAENWALERMACVDRSLLRLASYELLHCKDTPVGVIIDEAIEIAKSFSGEEAGGFINGILDKIKDSRT